MAGSSELAVAYRLKVDRCIYNMNCNLGVNNTGTAIEDGVVFNLTNDCTSAMSFSEQQHQYWQLRGPALHMDMR